MTLPALTRGLVDARLDRWHCADDASAPSLTRPLQARTTCSSADLAARGIRATGAAAASTPAATCELAHWLCNGFSRHGESRQRRLAACLARRPALVWRCCSALPEINVVRRGSGEHVPTAPAQRWHRNFPRRRARRT
ncbi:hypothetical protein ACPA9J_27070 [Pseudomonas aeruginosa]